MLRARRSPFTFRAAAAAAAAPEKLFLSVAVWQPRRKGRERIASVSRTSVLRTNAKVHVWEEDEERKIDPVNK
jgi:hypothetical protein